MHCILSFGSGLKSQTHKQPAKYPNKKGHLPIWIHIMEASGQLSSEVVWT